MPIKKDGTGKRWVEMEFIAPGTPEQVWQAMATGAGNAAWFTTATIEERVGGALTFDFGPSGSSSGEVTAWEPPHRFAYVERAWAEGAPPVATELTIAARGGGQCVVRMVHSLFSATDDWDDQMEGFESGWPGFFEVLKIYLRHFAGQPAHSFIAVNDVGGDHRTVWTRLIDLLGLANANVGDERRTPAEPEVLSGIVERVQQDDTQRYVLLRLDAPAPGVALLGTYRAGPTVKASATMYFDGPESSATARASEARWRGWLAERFQPVAG